MRRGRFTHWLVLLVGPAGHLLIFGPIQAYTIAKYLTLLGWPGHGAWPLGFVLGYLPIGGPILALLAAPRVWQISLWQAVVLFLFPLVAFLLLVQLPWRRVEQGPARVVSDFSVQDW